MRVLTGRAFTVSHVFYDDEDVITPSNVTATISRAGVVAETVTCVSGDEWEATFASLPTGVYELAWMGDVPSVTDVEIIEVVGSFIATIPEIRLMDPDLTNSKYSATDLAGYREIVETEFEGIVGRSFTRKCVRVTVTIDGSEDELWPAVHDAVNVRNVYETDGTLTALTIQVGSDGMLTGLSSIPTGTYLMDVEYGFLTSPPDVKRALVQRIHSLVGADRSGVPDRAISWQPADGGTYVLATAGLRGSETGIPDVDVVLKRYRYDLIRSVIG